MTLTHKQRLDRIAVRAEELAPWRIRAMSAVPGWTFNDDPIRVGDFWPLSDGVVRLKASAKVPAGWPDETVFACLDLGGEGLVTLDDGTGDPRRFGVDPYHREFPVAAREFDLSAECVARLPFGEPVREPRFMRADLIWRDEPVHRLHLLLTQLCEAVDALGDHEVVPHLLSAAEACQRELDWPSATTDYVSRISGSEQQQKIWQLPDTVRPLVPLSDQQRDSVVAAHDQLRSALKALSERFPPQGEVALTGHAHIDLAWLWPYGETRRKLRRTFHTVLSLMETSDTFRFNQSTAHYYAQIAEDDPQLFAKIGEQVRSGKWETVGGMWVEPDTNMPTGESLARQVLYGQRYFEKTFGLRHDVCWLPDCFGFSGGLPQILKQGGIDSFFTIKPNWNEANRMPADMFWWDGIDGSRVLAHTFDNPMQGYNGFVRPDCIMPTWKNFRGKTMHDKTLLAVGYGDGGGGVTPEMIEREVQLRDFPALPKARWMRVAEFFADAHARANDVDLPVWQGEIYLEIHRGTLTTQSEVKRLHRQAERSLITAETIASLVHMLGGKAPENLEDLWRVVLKNEFHDILPGSSIKDVYEDARGELETVISAGHAAQKDTLDLLADLLPPGEAGDGVLVVNPTLSQRVLRVGLPDGTQLATNRTIPPLGIAVFQKSDLEPEAGLSVGPDHIENAHLRVTIAPDGSLTELIHKASGRNALDGRGNQIWAYPQDKPRNWDAWDIEEDYRDRGEEIVDVESFEIVEDSPHRAAVRIVRRYRNSRIVQTLSLTASGRRLDIATELDWHDRRILLRALTPAAVRSHEATYECAFGVVRRPTHTNTSWDEAKFEVPGHRFVDLSEPGFGLAVLNDSKYGHSVRGSTLGISLLRSPVYPDPTADEGGHRFTYALMPHEDDWLTGGVGIEAEDLNQPLICREVKGKAVGTTTPIKVSGIPAALSAFKPAEDGKGLILRVFEPSGRRGDFAISLPEGWRAGEPLSVLEEFMARAGNADLMPFEIRSWRLSHDQD